MKDRETKKVRAVVVEHTDAETLIPFVLDSREPGAMVYTDEAAAYRNLPNHESVRHGVGQYVNGQAHTNGMESFWSLMKRGYHGTYHPHEPEAPTTVRGRIRGTAQRPAARHDRSDGADRPVDGREAPEIQHPHPRHRPSGDGRVISRHLTLQLLISA